MTTDLESIQGVTKKRLTLSAPNQVEDISGGGGNSAMSTGTFTMIYDEGFEVVVGG